VPTNLNSTDEAVSISFDEEDVVPAGLAIAILGTALSLVNFGIDEFVNPRLRGGGGTKLRTDSGRTVRMQVGFTPVLNDKPARPAEPRAATIASGRRGEAR